MQTTYYNVGTVNYLAAGSCNFNNAGETIWPLDQIVADTQFYVRDSVIDYITADGYDLTGGRRAAGVPSRKRLRIWRLVVRI